jgi:hypothetical protein
VLAQTASQAIDFHFFDLNLRVLDSGHHRSVFGVLSILAEAVAAGAIAVRAVPKRNLGGILAAALVGLLIVPRGLESYVRAFQRYDVPILVLPLAIVFVLVFALTLRDERRPRFIIWLSLGLLGCSFALHGIGPQADAVIRPHMVDYTWAYQLTGMLKHGAELAGWMLLTTGMIAAASRPERDELLTVADIAVLLRPKRPTVRRLDRQVR